MKSNHDRNYRTGTRSRFANAALVIALLAGCQTMPDPVTAKADMEDKEDKVLEFPMHEIPDFDLYTASNPAPDGSFTNSAADWPLKFRVHRFDVFAYSVRGYTVRYNDATFKSRTPGGRAFDDSLRPSSASLGDRYPDNMDTVSVFNAKNFPPPAIVDWRSADGTPLHAEVDIGEIFKDELVLHNVPREEAYRNDGWPLVILEINDRTINVYMRAHIPTRSPQIPGNPRSTGREDLIKAYSRTY